MSAASRQPRFDYPLPGKRVPSVVAVAVGLLIGGLVGHYFGALRPQPSADLVPGTPMAVTIENPPEPVVVRTISDAGSVARLVVEVNSLPIVHHSGSCPADNGSYFLLHFLYSNHDQWTVHVDGTGCRLVYVEGATPSSWALDSRLVEDIQALIKP